VKTKLKLIRVRVMVLNTTFNNISVISRRSGLLEEETGVPGENHQPVEKRACPVHLPHQ
jgi:hypothetical protein